MIAASGWRIPFLSKVLMSLYRIGPLRDERMCGGKTANGLKMAPRKHIPLLSIKPMSFRRIGPLRPYKGLKNA